MTLSSDTLNSVSYDQTLILAIELSSKSWVVAAQVPGLPKSKTRKTITPEKQALQAAIDGYRAHAGEADYRVDCVIATYEAGWSGFWLARWLIAKGVEVHVIQPSSVLADRRMHPMVLMQNCFSAP